MEQFKPIDDSLITSDVCIRCGHCCKWTSATQLSNGTGPEWMDVILGSNPLLTLKYHNKRDVEFPDGRIAKNMTPFEIEARCPKLKTNEEGHKLCSIYEDRPTTCARYNCFDMANKTERRPQNWDFIAGIIKEVHGVEVKWENELVENPGSQVKKGMDLIGIRDITGEKYNKKSKNYRHLYGKPEK